MRNHLSLAVLSAIGLTAGTAAAQTAAPPAPPLTPAPAAAPLPAVMAPVTPPAPVPAPPVVAVVPTGPAPGSTLSMANTYLQMVSLRQLRDEGKISKAEFESAVHDLVETSGQRVGEDTTLVLGKWATTLYGFAEADYIYDTTRSFNDLAGESLVARPAAIGGSNAGDNGRFQMGVRNSRIGFRMKAPEVAGVRSSGVAEMDFLGTQLPVGSAQAYQGSEAAYFQNPTFRVRHMYLKVETPVVDFLAGQTWSLFGWGPAYQPNTVEIQGVPGEVYQRQPQLKISKSFKTDPVTVDIAIAATRPIQRDSATPDGQAGLHLAVNGWTGMQTAGSTGTQIAPLSIAVTGLLRHVAVDSFSVKPKTTNDLGMSAIAIDGYVPVIPASKDNKDNALSINGEFTTGYGYADMFTNLNGGMTTYAAPPDATAASPSYTPDIDNGIVTYDGLGHLHGIEYLTYLFGAQYYLPGTKGRLWISGNYSHTESQNMHFYACATGCSAKPTAVMSAYDWFDFNLFVDPTPAIRVGIEYANFRTLYVQTNADGSNQQAINHRGQLSGWFIF